MMKAFGAALAAWLLCAAVPAFAQNEFSSPTTGKTVVGMVPMELDGSNVAHPNSAGYPFFVAGTVGTTSSGAVTNSPATVTLPATTTAYAAGQLIANSATAGSVVVPSFAIANSGGGAISPRLRLTTNDSTSTAWGGQTVQVDLWSAAPTFTNGDRGTWALATGSAGHLATYFCTFYAEQGDGTWAECSLGVGPFATPKLASGTAIYWTLNAVTGSGVTGASKVFTLTAELLN